MDTRGLSARDRSTLPNLLVPGAPKSGTTSVFWYLAQHPDVCPSDVKQINYFAPLAHGGRPERPLSAYAQHFAHWADERYRLDASPAYFAGGPAVIQAVASLPGEPRVLLLLRDPVARFASGYRFKRSQGRMPPDLDFAGFLARCVEMHRSGADRAPDAGIYRALDLGFYDEHVPPWLDTFEDRARVVFFEDLIDDPGREITEVFSWLGLSTYNGWNLDTEVRNPTLQPRSSRLQSLAAAANERAHRHLVRVPGIKKALRTTYYAVNGSVENPQPTPDDLRYLREIYAGSISRLAAYVTTRRPEKPPAWLASAIPA